MRHVPLGSFPLGGTVTGHIVKLEPEGVLVDFGSGHMVYVPLSELSLAEIKRPQDAVQLNESREFLVSGNYDGEYQYFFSDCLPEALEGSDRLHALALYRASLQCERPVSLEELTVHTQILAVQSDGVLVKIQWFLHNERPPSLTFSIRKLEVRMAWHRIRQLQVEDVTVYPNVVKTQHSAIVTLEGLWGLVSNVDRFREKLVSEAAAPFKILEAKEELNRLKLIQQTSLIKLRRLQSGQIVQGVVTAVKPYGIFVEIEGLSAFLNRSNINLPVEQVGQVFAVNTPVKALIAEVNLEKARIYLGHVARN